MTQIYAKTVKNHKAVKTLTYKNVKEYDGADFYFHLSEICRRLDIPTPVVINYHRESYESFNSLKFTPDDFIDSVPFDFLYLENIDL